MFAQIGKYRLVAEIARGGMGIVYLAVAQGPARFSKQLVVKELKPELVSDESFLEMFLEEARLAARLSHPNIVQTYEVGEENGRHYIVMDYLDGVPLSRVLRRKAVSFTRNMHLRVIAEILGGLHHAHTLRDFDGTPLGIVHRDVTPQNVFITFDGQAKMVDFGIAKALDSSVETQNGILKGKPAYMAPEQIRGEVDARADVFSAGVMLWEAVVGRRMWGKAGDVEVLTSILKSELPSLRDAAPNIPDDLARIVETALQRDLVDRYPSAAALQRDLEGWLTKNAGASMREIGAVVSELFLEERTTTRSTIERHLADLKANPTPETTRLPSLGPPPSLGTPTGASFSMGLARFTPPPSLPSRSAPRRSKLGFVAAGSVVMTALGFGLGFRALQPHPEPRPTATDVPTPNVATQASVNASATVPMVSSVAAPSAVVVASTASTVVVPRATWRPVVGSPTPVVRNEPAPPPAPTEPLVAVDKTGYLTLNTYPWTRVSSEGRVLGETPLFRVPMPVGTHVLMLENGKESFQKSIVVTIKPGETLTKQLAF